MATFTINPATEAHLGTESLDLLGLKPGDNIELDLQPDGNATWKPISRQESWSFIGNLQEKSPVHSLGSWEPIFGMFAGKLPHVATIEEINEASGPEWKG